MHKLRLLTTVLLVAAVMAVAIPMAAEAQMPPLSPFECTVFVDGDPADAGLPVQGYIGGVAKGVGAVDTGDPPQTADNMCTLILDITAAEIGELVTFTVDGITATTTPSPVYASPLFQEVQLDITSSIPPTVTTGAASPVSDESATLRGTLDTMGDYAGTTTVRVRFNWGTTSAVGTTTAWQSMTSTGLFTQSLPTLTPLTDYYFKAQAQGLVGGVADGGIQDGDVEQFTTLAVPVWPHELSLGDGLNIISTPVWLDSASDTVGDIIPTGYNGGYRWTGTSFVSLSAYYVWKPLEAFYVDVDAGTTATFVPTTDMKAPNTRTLASNRWYLIGSSPFGGSGCQTMDDVLVNLVSNWSIVVQPTAANQAGDSCTVNNPTALTLCAYEGAFVYVGAGITRTIVGFCTMPVE